LLALLVGVAALGTTACGDDDGPSGPGGAIAGTWMLEGSGGSEYIRITGTTITVFTDPGPGCFERIDLDITDVDGDVYMLDLDGMELELRIRRSGGELLVGDADVVYVASNVNVANLDLCEDQTGAHPLEACSTLPALPIGTTAGSLSSTDEAHA